MKSKINLHIHTIYSDGGKNVVEIVEGLKNAGVDCFSITDHDQVKGNIEAAKLAKEYDMAHFNGVELSCCFSGGEIGFDESYVCHIVGLDIDTNKMQMEIDRLAEDKNQKLHQLCDELIKDNYTLDLKRMENKSGKITERKHIAAELIRQKYVLDTNEAFSKILNCDKYKQFANNVPSIKEGIAIIQKCGGLAIWAHPFCITRGGKKSLNKVQVAGLIEKMIEYKIDGIEVYYQKFDKQQITYLATLAEDNGLLKSIGTDYHHAPFDEKKFPELLKYRESESLVFNLNGITPDETIIDFLHKRI